jgi:hypothetical protein
VPTALSRVAPVSVSIEQEQPISESPRNRLTLVPAISDTSPTAPGPDEVVEDLTINLGNHSVQLYDPWPSWAGSNCATCTVTFNTSSTDATGVRIWRSWQADNATFDSTTGSVTASNAWIREQRQEWPGGWLQPQTYTIASGTASAATVTLNQSWRAWQRISGGAPVSDEEAQRYLQEQQRREQEYAERRAREQEERKAAGDRAEILLRSCLSKAQEQSLDKHGWFMIVGKSGKKYRIRRGHSINIDVMGKKDKVDHRICFHPTYNAKVPDADAMLAQKLMLEACEDEALRLANRHAA